jgi:voltage-gated potassium channel
MSEYRFHAPLRTKLNEVIFGTETPAGQNFDIALIFAILISVLLVMLSTVDQVYISYRDYIYYAEWAFTIVFTIEYFIRIYCAPNPAKYFRSFYGIIDLLSVLPTYITFFFGSGGFLIVVRLLRVLRVFRVLRLMRFVKEANVLTRAMILSRHKIMVFMFIICILTTIFGSLMYAIEGPENGFSSIPKSIYWAIVTITTVGYGDIAPQTFIGQVLASLTMLMGYAIVAVPTGIITAGIAAEIISERRNVLCKSCGRHGHEIDAKFCKYCSHSLD